MPTSRRSKTTAQSERSERIIASPQFNGRTFANTRPVASGFKEGVERPTIREFLCGGARRIPAGPLPLVNPVARWGTRAETGLRVTWLGHSTLLIEIDGVRVLTDPVWSERASPLKFAGPKRFHPPPAPLDALPPLDAVIVSHDHYDHLDRSTVRALAKTGVAFITSLGVGVHLEKWGIPPGSITELDWWESTPVKGVTITAAPAQHFSGRLIKDRNATLWSSYHLRGPAHSFFYGADSGLTPDFSEIGRRFGPFDVVALEVGAYHPAWGDIHMGPVNAVTAREMLGSGALLPIHWGTFNLAMHPWDEPAETVSQLAPAHGLRLVMPRLGDPVEHAHVERVDPWWRSVATKGAPEPAGIERADDAAPAGWLAD
jgi:L-ascorbate metabolism protein UlaG (beta-lactamase superfamily)